MLNNSDKRNISRWGNDRSNIDENIGKRPDRLQNRYDHRQNYDQFGSLYYPGLDAYKKRAIPDTIQREIARKSRVEMNDPFAFVVEHPKFIGKVRELVSIKYPKEVINVQPKDRERIERELTSTVKKMLLEDGLLPQEEKVPVLIHHIFAEVLGLGDVIEELLDQEDVDEIIIQNYDFVQIERHGQLEDTDYKFSSFKDLKGKIEKIIRPLNMEFDTLHPNIDAQLPDGSRISASIPPFRANGQISLDIRKFAPHVHPLSWYVQQYRSQAPEMVQFEEMCTRAALNILVSGGTGSGKTTFLNSLSIAIPNSVRIITVEDTLELQLQQTHVESYQKVGANMEGKGGISMQQAVIDALRKRPDRIIIGEVRGGEIVEMINAMNTGHDGSLSTIHANSSADCISRATIMILSNPETSHLQESAIHQMIGSAINLIFQTSRLDDGSRKIISVTEIVGYGEDGYTYLKKVGKLDPDQKLDRTRLYLQDIFRFIQTEQETNFENGQHRTIVHGKFITTGYVPRCLRHLQSRGEHIDEDFFKERVLLEV